MSTKRAPPTTTATTSSPCPAPLPSLVQNATLTNSELFGTILSTIKSSKSIRADAKTWIHTSAQGHDAIASIVARAAVGSVGCRTTDDWIRYFGDAYSSHQSSAAVANEGGSSHGDGAGDNGAARRLGDIVKDMPSDGQATRLRVALDAIDAVDAATSTTAQPQSLSPSSTSSNNDAIPNITVRQAVGLLRGTALVGDLRLQSRALDFLVRVLPRLASHPLQILAVVQTPILRLLGWCNGLEEEMGAPESFFKSESQRRVFQSMIDYGKEEEDEGDAKKDSSSSNSNGNGNPKRKRPWEDMDECDQSNREEATSTTMMRLVEAAHLARRGDQRGAKHGAVLCVPADDSISMEGLPIPSPVGLQKIIGRGWNHNILLDSSKGKNKIVLHSEVHAVADAIRRFGEEDCFEKLFPRATVVIVELVDDCAYEKCHPCPKCNTFLRAVGVTRALHSTPGGTMDETDMSPGNSELLARDVVRVPFRAACNEMQIRCKRLDEIEEGKESLLLGNLNMYSTCKAGYM